MGCIGNASVHTCTAAHAVDSIESLSGMVVYFISSFPVFESAMGKEVALVAIGEWLMVILIQEKQLWWKKKWQRNSIKSSQRCTEKSRQQWNGRNTNEPWFIANPQTTSSVHCNSVRRSLEPKEKLYANEK